MTTESARAARPRTGLPWLLLLAMTAMIVRPAFGQTTGQLPGPLPGGEPGRSQSPPGWETPRPEGEASDRLSYLPLKVESLGLSLLPPEVSHFRTQRNEERTIVSILDAAKPRTWAVRIQPLGPGTLGGAPGETTTPAAQIETILESWRSGEAEFKLLSNVPVRYGDRPGQLCYLEHQPPGSPKVVWGWLILARADEPMADEMVVFTIQILADSFPRVSDLLDRSFATMRVKPLSEVAETRRLRLGFGRTILAGITPERLRGLIGPTKWYRQYLPTSASGGASRGAGEAEIGYFAVTFSEAPLGAIDPGRDAASYGPAEQVRGLLVTVSGRTLEATPRGAPGVYDSQAFYWLAWDQSQEAWSIRGTRRIGNQQQSEAETGIRPERSVGDPAGTLTVVSSQIDGATRDQRSWRVPNVYMAQAIRWGLGRLLPRDYAAPRTFGSYVYETSAGTMAISLRIDRWAPLEDGTGGWELSTQIRSDAKQVVSTHAADGSLIRRTSSGGLVIELIELESLHRLWKRKGLDTGPMR